MLIPFNNLTPVLEDQKGLIQDAINRVLDSGSFILGNEGKALEKEVAAFVGMDEGIAVANGTDAITLSLLAVRYMKSIHKGGALVATVANSAPATVVAIRRAGCVPVFVDVLPNGLMDPADLAKKMHKNILAVVPVHLYGQVADIFSIDEVCRKFDTAIVEDAAQALGSNINYYQSPRIKTKCISFYPTKNLGALGDGGMILSNNGYFSTVLQHLRNYGMTPDGDIVFPDGFNSRLDEMQAAILRVRLQHLAMYNWVRNELAFKYFQMLRPEVWHRLYLLNSKENYHLFTIRHPNRDGLRNHLIAKGIETKIHYPYPAHKYTVERWHIKLPETEAHCREVLSLPLWPGMDTADIVRVCKAVNEYVYA